MKVYFCSFLFFDDAQIFEIFVYRVNIIHEDEKENE